MDLTKTLDINNCISSVEVSVRFSSSSDRLYVEATEPGGCISPSEIYNSFNGSKTASPLYSLETGVWNLDSDFYIEDGVTLVLIGKERGGEVDELRMLSNNEKFVNLRGHGGNILMDGTKVFSWNNYTQSVDENQDDGRAYISCLSEKLSEETCDGAAKKDMGECRLDVLNTELGYLGYHASESWGFSYKVRGFCKDKSNPEVFDSVSVYGDIKNSLIHHNYYGHYSFGLLGGVWDNNEIHSNTVYGFDPHDYSRDLMISNNLVYNNVNHGIIASKWCSNVTVVGNTVTTSSVGIFLHSLGDDAVVKGNTVTGCESGIAFLESSGGVISENTLTDNGIGIRFSVGSTNNLVENNVIEGSSSWDVSTYMGNEDTVEMETGRVSNIVFKNNKLSTVSIKDSDRIEFHGNEFIGDSEFELFDSSCLILGNTGLDKLDQEDSCLDSASDIDGELCDFDILSPTPEPTPTAVVLPGTEPSITPIVPSIAPSFAPISSSESSDSESSDSESSDNVSDSVMTSSGSNNFVISFMSTVTIIVCMILM